jgi:hypothetical protein
MKKLLIVGESLHTYELIVQAKKRGIFTIVTDNRLPEKARTKLIADDHWEISIFDVDELEKKALAEGITSIVCGASESCISVVRQLCKRLSLPFWVGDKAWEYTNDKAAFKEKCRKVGLHVAQDYSLDLSFNADDLKKIVYPVVVKPVDGCSGIGVNICRNEEELKKFYIEAYDISASHRVIVEQYCEGDGITSFFVFKNGKAYNTLLGRIQGKKQDNNTMVFMYAINEANEDYRLLLSKLEKLLNEIGCTHGAGFVELIDNNGEFIVIEMNYRLNGGIMPNGDLSRDAILDYALSENTLDVNRLHRPTQSLFGYGIWLRPGIIAKIDGVKTIQENFNIFSMTITKKVGDEVIDGSGMRRMLTYIVFSEEPENFKKSVEFINRTLIVNDTNGNDMVYRYDYSEEMSK